MDVSGNGFFSFFVWFTIKMSFVSAIQWKISTKNTFAGILHFSFYIFSFIYVAYAFVLIWFVVVVYFSSLFRLKKANWKSILMMFESFFCLCVVIFIKSAAKLKAHGQMFLFAAFINITWNFIFFFSLSSIFFNNK